MARVFLSYASEDRQCAGQLHQWLVTDRHEVFWDQDSRNGIEVGEEWDKRLHERLRWADAVVCVVTSASVNSTWCTAEISIALSRGSRLLPVRAELGVNHPLLPSAQYADLTRDPDAARAALTGTLRRIDAAGGFGWPDDLSPFPGLRPFDVEQHRVFFGRVSETEELAESLRSPAEQTKAAMLLMVGPSGCGKSSLVRAGLLHVMAEEPGWLTLRPMLPGADPVAALARELAAAARHSGLDWTVDGVHRVLAERGLVGVADELLLANPGGPLRRLLLVVDQWEELLTQTEPADRARFAQLLRPALSGPVQVVATLRPEFLAQLLVDSDLAVLPTRTYILQPLHHEALKAVIEGPARAAGIDVAKDLVARLVADTDSGEALPLLAFTLAQLANGVGRGGRLSQHRYDELGGVRGALTRQADAALAEAITTSGRRREEVIAGLLRLVTVDEQGRPTRRRVPRDDLPESVIQEVKAFVRRRLLITDADKDRVVVGVAHEAFLSAWPPLAQAIKENVSALRACRAAEQAAAEWDNDGRPHARLWERGQLAAAVADTDAHLHGRDLVTDRINLNPTARAFLRASIRRDRIRRGRAITILSVLLILAVAAAGIALVAQRAADRERNIAVSQRVAAQVLELRATNPALAAQLALAAYRLVPTPEAHGSLLSAVASPDVTQLTGHTNAVKGVAISPDGHTLATGSDDKTVRLWDISVPHHPRPLSTLRGHTNYIPRLAFSPDGHILATASDDTTTRLWDIRDPRRPTLLGILTGHTGVVYWVAFSPDGNTVATASEDTTARLWDVRDLHHPLALGTLIGHSGGVSSVAFSPDGRTLATSSQDTTARLWEVGDPSQPRLLDTLTGHANMVYSVAFSPDGRTLATGSYDNTARLWNLSGPIMKGHANTVAVAAFSPDGRTLATASYDRTARLWDVQDARQPSPLATIDHTGGVSSVTFSSDGRLMATGNRDDKTARLWDIRDPHSPTPLATLTGHERGIYWVALSPDGHTLATAGQDTTVRLWDVGNPHQPKLLDTLKDHTDIVYSVAFSPDGNTLASASGDHTARLWNVRDPAHPSPLATLTDHSDIVYSVAFSPDGHTLATASADNTARLWDVRDPHHPSPLGVLTGHESSVNGVTFSPDGRTVATASADNTARLWDTRDLHHPSPLGALTGHTSSVRSVAFSPDGHTLATASADSTARLWETNVDSVAARICSTTPTITPLEWNQYLPTCRITPHAHELPSTSVTSARSSPGEPPGSSCCSGSSRSKSEPGKG